MLSILPRRLFVKAMALSLAGAGLPKVAAAQSTMSKANAHQFALTAITGEPMAMADFAGKVVLLVNTASKCSFTDQYGLLQALHDRYGKDGLVIIGVPSNEFGKQEPGTEDDIAKFVAGQYQVSFPMAAKTKVKGADAHPLYQWLAEQAGPLGVPRWNFHKYLIGADGEMIDWFTSATGPQSAKMTRAIEGALRSQLSAL
jgi:glutathione peroxidase